jgi:hypothetical protein
MSFDEYLKARSDRLRMESASIRRDYATHRPTAGTQREDLVEAFLVEHLPKRFGVSSGLVVSCEGEFAPQADLLVVDALNNAPMYGQARSPIWSVESVYALVEVKTEFTPAAIADAVAKGRRFKRLTRKFSEVAAATQRIAESLFVIWAFDGPKVEVAADNLRSALVDVPRSEQPDLIIVLDRYVATCGDYLVLSQIGHETSDFRRQLVSKGANLTLPTVRMQAGQDALLAWYVWFDSWLSRAGDRLADPVNYLPESLRGGG